MPDHPYLTLGFAIFLSAICLLLIRLGLPDRLYEQLKGYRFAWFWLRVFDIPVTRENCVQLIRIGFYIFMSFWLLFSTLTVVFNG